MARVTLSLGILAARALSIAARSRGFPVASPPPMRAATVSSLLSLVLTLDRLASTAAFLCLMVLHLLCPDMKPLPARRSHCSDVSYHSPRGQATFSNAGQPPRLARQRRRGRGR